MIIRLCETLIMEAMTILPIEAEAIMKAIDLIKKKYTHWAIIIVKKAIVVSMATAAKNLRTTIGGLYNPFIITGGRITRDIISMRMRHREP